MHSMTTESLILGLLLGSIGMGYAIYGKKQRRGAALLAGVGLMALPYAITNVFAVLGLGALIAALPFFAKF